MSNLLNKGELLEYIKDGDGRKIGVILATSKDNIGWSILHDEDSYQDKGGNFILFDKEKGVKLARKRSVIGYDYWETYIQNKIKVRFKFNPEKQEDWQEAYRRMPVLVGFVYNNLLQMKERAERYYNGTV